MLFVTAIEKGRYDSVMKDEIVVEGQVGAESDAPTSLLRGFDVNGLYSVEVVTDLKSGEIQVYTPITVGRVRDTGRPIRFFSSVMVTYRGRPLQCGFELKASSLEEALAGFTEQGDAAARAYIENLEQQALRTKLASGTSAANALGPRMPIKTH